LWIGREDGDIALLTGVGSEVGGETGGGAGVGEGTDVVGVVNVFFAWRPFLRSANELRAVSASFKLVSISLAGSDSLGSSLISSIVADARAGIGSGLGVRGGEGGSSFAFCYVSYTCSQNE
jgi:MFS-type transporter involved in bile tolerance (Atg22 family)